jgi:hypothetical protein
MRSNKQIKAFLVNFQTADSEDQRRPSFRTPGNVP